MPNTKKKSFFQPFLGRSLIRCGTFTRFTIYRKLLAEENLTLKYVMSKGTAGVPSLFFLKKTRKPTKMPQKLGEIWAGQTFKC